MALWSSTRTAAAGCAAAAPRTSSGRSSSCATTSSATSRRRAAALARTLELRVGAAGDALDRFEAAWNRAAEGRTLTPLRVLTLKDLPLLLRTLTPARWALLEHLRGAGPSAIYELLRQLVDGARSRAGEGTRGRLQERAHGGVEACRSGIDREERRRSGRRLGRGAGRTALLEP